MGSRVNDIKKKFEGLCDASQEPTKLKSNPSRSHLKPRSSHLILPLKKNIEIVNSTLKETVSRGNIKRSHAFRSDRNNRNPTGENLGSLSCTESSNNIVKDSLKGNLSNKNQCSSEESKVLFAGKQLGTSFDCSPKLNILQNRRTDSLEKHFNNPNMDNSFESNFETKQPSIFDIGLNGKNTVGSHSKEIESYSTVSKHAGLGKQNKLRPSLLELGLKAIEKPSLHDPTRPTEKSEINCDEHSFLHNEINNLVENCRPIKLKNKTSINEKNKVAIEDNVLSNTLKKVLSSPLPSGPPPKKPPRTFAHTSEWQSTPNSPTYNSPTTHVSSSDDSAYLQNENVISHKPIVRPVRSKTESQIMLKKLEIALSNHHHQGRILEPKNEGNQLTKNVSKPSSVSFLSNKDKTKGSINHLTIDRKCSLPDSPNVDINASSSTGCFGVDLLSCSNSMDLMKSSHIYEVPFESNSQFYVKESNERESGISSLYTKDNNIPGKLRPSKNSPMQYGKIKTSDKFSDEHVYAKPHNIRDKIKTSKSEPETNSVSQLVKMINNNGKINSMKSKMKVPVIDSPVLHYMSTPILEKVSLLQSPTAPPFPEKPPPAQKKFFQTNGTKSFPSRSTSFDLEGLNKKGVASRSFSVDYSGDKDFQIDKEKIQMMVNEVYSKCLAMPQDSDSESVASTPDEGVSKPLPGKHTTSPEEAQKERQQRTAERKTYLKRVCSRAKSFHRPSVNFPHLFEYLMLIGLDLNPSRCKVPYIKAKYPEDAIVPRGIEQLCFPDAEDWPPQACADESGAGSCYCIIITNSSGARKYGYCRRVQPEGAPICLPLAYCIVSPYKANFYFAQVLAELESRHGQPEQLLSDFIHQLYQCPFPAPGQGLLVTNPTTNEKTEILLRKLDQRQEEVDIARLLNIVRFSVFLQLFATLLLERKVILLSYSISKLSTCIEGLCASLYPFHWQHTLVPLVPSTMLDLCHAPTPYVIGLLKPRDPNAEFPVSFPSIDQVLVVDVDESRVLQSCGDESTVLPPRLCRGLREALQCAIPDKNTPLTPAHNLVASEALIALFVQLVGHYRDHIITSSTTGQRDFQRESFVKSVTSNTVQNFLDWFSESTMFTAFIESRLDRSVDPRGLFEQRCVENLAQQQASTSKSYRANINKTVKSFGDRFKEWTSST